jgi:quercetin dioxygenase-like cupin family protein
MRIPHAVLLASTVVSLPIFAQTEASNPLDHSRVFAYEQVKPHSNANGSESRFFFTGKLATGETVSVHSSVQPAGIAPPALHKIQHSEIIVVQEGTVEYHHDGVVEGAGQGSILYVKIGTDHFVVNVGKGPAKYTVLQIGGDVTK